MSTFLKTTFILFLLCHNLCFSAVRVIKIAYFHMPPHMIKTNDPLSPKGTLVEYL